MTKQILIGLVATAWLSCAALAQDPVLDFRDIEWGTARSDMPFTLKKATPKRQPDFAGSDLYQRSGEDLTIGTARLKNIYYGFDEKGSFNKVVLEGNPDSNEDMEYILQQRFGKADGRVRRAGKFIRGWSVGRVDVIFTESKSKDYTVILEAGEDPSAFYETNAHIEDF
jgi:hypothetical protein